MARSQRRVTCTGDVEFKLRAESDYLRTWKGEVTLGSKGARQFGFEADSKDRYSYFDRHGYSVIPCRGEIILSHPDDVRPGYDLFEHVTLDSAKNACFIKHVATGKFISTTKLFGKKTLCLREREPGQNNCVFEITLFNTTPLDNVQTGMSGSFVKTPRLRDEDYEGSSKASVTMGKPKAARDVPRKFSRSPMRHKSQSPKRPSLAVGEPLKPRVTKKHLLEYLQGSETESHQQKSPSKTFVKWEDSPASSRRHQYNKRSASAPAKSTAVSTAAQESTSAVKMQSERPDSASAPGKFTAIATVEQETTSRKKSKSVSVDEAESQHLYSKNRERLFIDNKDRLFRDYKRCLYEEYRERLFDDYYRRLYDEHKEDMYRERHKDLFMENHVRLFNGYKQNLFNDNLEKLYEEQRVNLFNENQARMFQDCRKQLYKDFRDRLFDKFDKALFKDFRDSLLAMHKPGH